MKQNVRLDVLKALASMPGPSGGPKTEYPDDAIPASTNPDSTDFDLEAWITEKSFTVVDERPWKGGHLWICIQCPWGSKHTNKVAFQ